VTERRIPRSTSLRDALKLRSELIDYSRYAMQIEPYIEAYGPDRVLIAFSERFRHCPQFEFERICRFLGCRGVVKWRTDRSFHNRSRDRMMAGFMTHFIVNNEPFRRVRQGLVPKSIRDVVRSLLASNIEKPEVSEETAGYLRDIFDRDLRQLGKYFSCDLSYDTYADVADAACGEA